MRRQIIELQRLDMGQRPCRLEAGNVRNRRVRSEVEEDLVARQRARRRRRSGCTSSVFGATKRPLPMINSAPLAL